MKRRFKILDDATPFFPFATQVEIVVVCCIIHNWVIEDGGDELIIPETETIPTISHQKSSHGQAQDHAFMVNFRQKIANSIWEDRQTNIRTDVFLLCMNLCIFSLYELMCFCSVWTTYKK
jgi:hypothetical protein